jgi:hypothetical protein
MKPLLLLASFFAVSLTALGIGSHTGEPTTAPLGRELIKARHGAATNWAGYAVTSSPVAPQTNAVSSVKGSWIVPTVTCTSASAYSSMWVGIDGYSSGTVEQIGTAQDCANGKGSYYAWYEMYPKPAWRINNAVRPGDQMSGEVKWVGGNKFTVTLSNSTAGWSYTTTQTSKGQRSSAEWIAEAPWSGGVLPLANFGTARFFGSTVVINGTTGKIDTAGAFEPITMATADGVTIKATVSALSAGDAFSVVWAHE